MKKYEIMFSYGDAWNKNYTVLAENRTEAVKKAEIAHSKDISACAVNDVGCSVTIEEIGDVENHFCPDMFIDR